MRCSNCGTDLPDEALFCFKCGTKIEKDAAPENRQTFRIGDRELVFGADLLAVKDLRRKFSDYAWECATAFAKYYKSNVTCFDDIFEKAFAVFEEKSTAALHFGVRVLMDYGVDYIDVSQLADAAGDRIDPTPVLTPFIKTAEEIQEKADALSGYKYINCRSNYLNWQSVEYRMEGMVLCNHQIKGAKTQ